MQQKNNTIWRIIGLCVAFVAFMGIFGAIGGAMLIVGIYWAFELFFSVGWWASLIVMLCLLALYATALSFALELLRGENE